MLNDELNKYKDLYSKLIDEFVVLHNSNTAFVKFTGRETGTSVTRQLRKIREVCTLLKQQSVSVRKEKMSNLKLEKAQLKEEKRNNKKKKKNVVDVSK